MSATDTSVDLADPRLWDDGPPHGLMDELRAATPVHWSPQRNAPEEGGFWSVLSHELLQEASRDHETFSSEERGIFLVDDIGVPLDVQRMQMISMDGLRHDRIRRLVSAVFTPRRIAAHEDAIRQIVRHNLDRVDGEGSFDLVTDLARPVPARVIGSLLGTPPEDDSKLVEWTQVFTAFEDPEVQARWDDSNEVLMEILAYVGEQMAEREDDPRDDLLTALMQAEVDGTKLDGLELTTFFILLMAAGNDSTRATYSGIMRQLLEHPDQLELVRDNPELIPAAVEEGLRTTPPFSFMGRAATRDTELGDVQIKQGDRVLLWYLASNRDPAVFDDPHTFDVTRHDVDEHQSFGAGGRHFCLGAALARLELKVWVEETLERFPDLELAGEPEYVRALFLAAQHSSIPVRAGRVPAAA